MLDNATSILAKLSKSKFDQCEVRLTHHAMTEMQIDAGQVSLLRTTETDSLGLRALVGGRYGTLSLNQLTEKSVEEGIEKLKEACLASPVDEARCFAPGDSKIKSYEFGPLSPSLKPMHERVLEFAETVKSKFPDMKLEQSGLQHNFSRSVLVNSLGLNAEEAQGYYSFGAMFSGKRGHKTSGFNFSSATSASLEKPLLDWGVMEINMRSCIEEIDHRPFEGKFIGPVLLTPESFADFLNAWVGHLKAERFIANNSCLKSKLNTLAASSLLSFEIAPMDPSFTQHDFLTADGYLSSPSQILENGVLKSFMLSDYGARKTNSIRATNSGQHWKVAPGTQTIDELIRPIQRGVWLGRFSGGNPAANGDFSGVAKNSFLIENGRRTQPISEVMINGNIFDLFNGIKGLSKEMINDGTKQLPWALAESVTVSGS